jgi:hypothetical protein
VQEKLHLGLFIKDARQTVNSKAGMVLRVLLDRLCQQI